MRARAQQQAQRQKTEGDMVEDEPDDGIDEEPDADELKKQGFTVGDPNCICVQFYEVRALSRSLPLSRCRR